MRSEAEAFVTAFLDYMNEYDILDKLNKQTQRMERSPGVSALVKQAEAVFPRKKGPQVVSDEQMEAAKLKSPDVIVDTREMFARKTQQNGGTRQLIRDLIEGKPGSEEAAADFISALDGTKEFHETT